MYGRTSQKENSFFELVEYKITLLCLKRGFIFASMETPSTFPIEVKIHSKGRDVLYRMTVEYIEGTFDAETFKVHGKDRSMTLRRIKYGHQWNWQVVELPGALHSDPSDRRFIVSAICLAIDEALGG